jgi:ubiquinone biosynthesis protein UbiJ
MSASNGMLDENDLLRRISDGTAAETGSSFFRAVVKNLSQALGTHGAWITEYLPEAQQLRALAFWLADDFVDQYVYDIVGGVNHDRWRRLRLK